MRIRTIKPEFWSHPVYGRLDDQTKWLALAILSVADDHGYFLADPMILRGEVAPFREDLASLSRSLAKLIEIGWFEQSEHPEMGLIGHIKNWDIHQKVDHPSNSKIMKYWPRESLAKSSRGSRERLALDQGSGIRDQGSGNIKGGDVPKDTEKTEIPEELLTVWHDYEVMRNKIRRPMTEHAKRLILSELEKLATGNCAQKILILEQSIKNSWQGVFPLKSDPAGQKQAGKWV